MLWAPRGSGARLREVAADPRSPAPLPWTTVLLEEHEALHGALDPARRARIADAVAAPGAGNGALAEIEGAAFAAGNAALCLSGGGIRSASFSVGVLQALARHGLLGRFDYLSTVSGGGFAGAWLTAWLRRAQDDPAARREFARFESPGAGPGAVEPAPLIRLRRYIRYLSPREGFFSADAWTIGATMARNLLLNWLVLLPFLAAALLAPRLHAALIRAADRDLAPGVSFALRDPETWVLLLAASLLATAIVFTVRDLPSYGNARSSQRRLLVRVLAPLCLGAVVATYFWALDSVPIDLRMLLAASAVGHAGLWILSALLAGTRGVRPRTWAAAALSAIVPACGAYWMMQVVFPNGTPLSSFYVAAAFPLLLLDILLGIVLFIGLAGSEIDAADLEWWSRLGAWVLIAATGWIAVSAIVFTGPWLFERVKQVVASMLNLRDAHASAVTGLLAPAAGAVGAWLSRPSSERGTSARRYSVALWGPVFAVALLASMAWANDRALVRLSRFPVVAAARIGPGVCTPQQEAAGDLARCRPAGTGFVEVFALGASLLLLGLASGRMVPVNKFSLAGMYRLRLVRTFLGASRAHRHANPFTGFDPGDDVPMSDLASVRPLHVTNATLNMVADPQLGRQERKAQSFTTSPLHTGTAALGYRPSSRFASEPGTQGITLGTAVTISGAAASPSMGMYSTPAMTFLMTLLNARLGSWVGNPGRAGSRTWFERDPPRGGGLLVLDELLGRTTDTRPYVYLSDGGHFDNLGLVEMVRRRCRFIVVVDAGADPGYSYADLANAVRRIRIDLGVRIDMDAVDIDAARQGAGNPHALVGRIIYEDAGGPASVGTLVYLKPALSGDEPVDVRNYAASHPAFPHESTTNQWFSEAQFESYRVLGSHSVEATIGSAASGERPARLSVPEFCAAALAYRQRVSAAAQA